MAYAVAGLATASGGVAEGAIHYSGHLDVVFRSRPDRREAFPLDGPGDSLVFEHRGLVLVKSHFAGFKAVGHRSASMRGHSTESYAILSNLNRGSFVSQGYFRPGYPNNSFFGTLAYFYYGEFRQRGVGFIGFAFNNGAGKQYGWARVYMGGLGRQNSFKLLDYAYADPGESIQVGQTSDAPVTGMGSLGLLAAGATGLLTWRKARTQVSA